MPAGFTPPPSGNDWGAFAYGSPVPQPNGFVTGPDSATDGNLAVFDGTSGTLIKDGGPVPSGGSSDATITFHSSGDSNDPVAFPFTSDNACVKIVDVGDVEVLTLFSGGNSDTDGSLYVGNSLPAGFAGVVDVAGGSQNNVAVGLGSMAAATADSATNTAVGNGALKNLEDGTSNVAIGTTAGQSIVDGNNNVAIGQGTDVLEASGSNITLIGSQTDSTAGVTDNAIGIGYLVEVTADNTAVIGNDAVTDVYFGSDAGLAKAHASTFIGNVMALTPQSDPPGSPTEGMIYSDTDHHLYYYNGSIWKQLDN